jgi:thiazole synthase
MNKLLPVPMSPIKGQMLSLRPTRRPSGPSEALLSRGLFSDDCYIIPKLDGRIVVGATVEPEAGFDRRVTAKGVMELTSKALRLCPGLAELEVEETWAGLRPTTPDMMPVLGNTPWDNLFVAGGCSVRA